MISKDIKISILIIGYNTASDLKNLLKSIKNLNNQKRILEIIYVDDGSKDDSLNVFENFEIGFTKNQFQFQNNVGRVASMQKAIDLAKGDWSLLLQSNVVVLPDLINQYINLIKKFNVVALVGKIVYSCKNDTSFELYLNNIQRGCNRFNNGKIINFKYLLFGNCLVLTALLKQLGLNLSLKKYGGEELDFAYRLNKRYPQKIRYCGLSVVRRNNHPNLYTHLGRLYEFGKINFNYLNQDIQKIIIKNSLFLRKNILIKCLIFMLYYFLSGLSKIKKNSLGNYYIYRALMFSSILKGYYSSK